MYTIGDITILDIMQIECAEHQQLLSFFCTEPSCQAYLCQHCRYSHANHKILDAKEFANYALRELKRRESEVGCALFNIEDSELSGKSIVREYARKITESTTQLLDCIKEATESVYKRSEGALKGIVKELKESNKTNNLTELTEEKERLQEIKSELTMAKESEHFLGVQQAWEKLKVKPNIASVSSHNLSELLATFEAIKATTKKLIEKLSSIGNIAYTSLSDLKRRSVSSIMQSMPEHCSVCGDSKPIYLVQQCSHGICFDCAQEEICEKTSSKGLKVVDAEIECKACGFEGPAIYIVHQECGCMINAKGYKELFDSPYYWDRNTKKFEWPKCRQGKELNQEDIFFIYGGSAFTFLDEFLPLEEFSEIIKSNSAYKYMILCRELRKEDIESVKKILASTSVEHVSAVVSL
eukprot:TRINITY_DN3876_c0_g1_i13.p1 TRINITY_DN3876_c0_g1~~TRINITY_DN3876_c0_g1_i13.p1  ORF type:complete len:411 (-),score=118.16 TRINITY_DN3876_c0_g1_i13:1498-2730(-)